MWININTNATFGSYNDIRNDCSGTSFPAVMTDDLIAPFGYLPVTMVAPVFDPATQSVAPAAPIQVNGVWTQQWTVTNLSATAIAANTAAANAAQIQSNEYAIQTFMDAKAQSRGYSDLKSAVSYAAVAPVVPATDPNFAMCEKYRTEGNALQVWMAKTWATAYNYLATVTAGTNPMPNQAQAVAMIPAFAWPDSIPAAVGPMTVAQIQALTTDQVGVLSVAQIQVMTIADLQAFTPAQVAALTAAQVAAMSIAQIGAFTLAQNSALTAAAKAALSPADRKSVV